MRLIDIDDVALLKTVSDGGLSAKALWRRICKQPTVDAVPVTRCYECKYFREFEKGFSTDWDGSCQYWNTHSTVYSNFCGCGVRMDKDEKI